MTSGLPRALIAGGGIGGLCAAIACTRAGFEATVFERAASMSPAGAGIQLGPNATRVLHGWGLRAALASVACIPDRLVVRDARSGAALGTLELGPHALRRYGAPYATLHRADLQQLLLDAVAAQPNARLRLHTPITRFVEHDDGIAVETAGTTVGEHNDHEDRRTTGRLLVGADGLWSPLREQLLGDGPPHATGHFAYRALVPQMSLSEPLRSNDVDVWLGPRLHVVAYPVQRDELLNLVGIVHAPASVNGDAGGGWDEATDAAKLLLALSGCCARLQDLVRAAPGWRRWTLFDRPPMAGPREHGGHGRLVLVGDAAHPMRPYLAQGAGMAIEDAAELERVLTNAGTAADIPQRLQRFAQRRWARNARVQARAVRNGRIFHANGAVAFGRDMAMRLLGARLLDLPWLYGWQVDDTVGASA